MVVSGLEDFVDWIWAPVFWYGIVAPVALLLIATLYLFWLNRKADKLYRLTQPSGPFIASVEAMSSEGVQALAAAKSGQTNEAESGKPPEPPVSEKSQKKRKK